MLGWWSNTVFIFHPLAQGLKLVKILACLTGTHGDCTPKALSFMVTRADKPLVDGYAKATRCNKTSAKAFSAGWVKTGKFRLGASVVTACAGVWMWRGLRFGASEGCFWLLLSSRQKVSYKLGAQGFWATRLAILTRKFLWRSHLTGSKAVASQFRDVIICDRRIEFMLGLIHRINFSRLKQVSNSCSQPSRVQIKEEPSLSTFSQQSMQSASFSPYNPVLVQTSVSQSLILQESETGKVLLHCPSLSSFLGIHGGRLRRATELRHRTLLAQAWGWKTFEQVPPSVFSKSGIDAILQYPS